MARFHDRVRREPGLVKARKLEEGYARQLRKVARQVGMIVEGWYGQVEGELDPAAIPGLQAQLEQYAKVLDPWARSTAQRIGQEIAIKERRGWAEHARLMSRSMREELANAPTGDALKLFLNEQVKLIKSLPVEAGQRVHELTLRGLETSTRASEVAKEIMRSGEVTASRATLIARTEISRTASALTMARAMSIGSDSYIWRIADRDARPSHFAMEGKVCQWAKPPTVDGMIGHAGCFPNCRCWPEPIIPGIDLDFRAAA